jgi:hypothetical protein
VKEKKGAERKRSEEKDVKNGKNREEQKRADTKHQKEMEGEGRKSGKEQEQNGGKHDIEKAGEGSMKPEVKKRKSSNTMEDEIKEKRMYHDELMREYRKDYDEVE